MGLLLIAAGMFFWFHIISQSENAVLASQSEEVTIAGCGQVVDIPD